MYMNSESRPQQIFDRRSGRCLWQNDSIQSDLDILSLWQNDLKNSLRSDLDINELHTSASNDVGVHDRQVLHCVEIE